MGDIAWWYAVRGYSQSNGLPSNRNIPAKEVQIMIEKRNDEPHTPKSGDIKLLDNETIGICGFSYLHE